MPPTPASAAAQPDVLDICLANMIEEWRAPRDTNSCVSVALI